LLLFNELFDQNNFRTIKTGSKKLTIEKRLNKSFEASFEYFESRGEKSKEAEKLNVKWQQIRIHNFILEFIESIILTARYTKPYRKFYA